MKTTNNDSKPTQQDVSDAFIFVAGVQRALEEAQARGDAAGLAVAQNMKEEAIRMLTALFARA